MRGRDKQRTWICRWISWWPGGCGVLGNNGIVIMFAWSVTGWEGSGYCRHVRVWWAPVLLVVIIRDVQRLQSPCCNSRTCFDSDWKSILFPTLLTPLTTPKGLVLRFSWPTSLPALYCMIYSVGPQKRNMHGESQGNIICDIICEFT